MYKAIKKTTEIWRYIVALALHTDSWTVHWEDNKICISVVEAKIDTPRVKHIGIPIFFLQEQFDNFFCKYENSIDILENICTKPCSDTIISWSTKWMTGFRFYPTSGTEHYQLMQLHEFFIN